MLAVRAAMRAATGERYSLDWRIADKTGFATTHVNLVFKLEEATNAVRVDVIGYR